MEPIESEICTYQHTIESSEYQHKMCTTFFDCSYEVGGLSSLIPKLAATAKKRTTYNCQERCITREWIPVSILTENSEKVYSSLENGNWRELEAEQCNWAVMPRSTLTPRDDHQT